jgi:hypothetical protein
MFRTRMIQTTSLVAGLLLMSGSFAQAPAGAPAGTTGLCKDGTYSSAASKRGACSGHKGVKTWYAASPGDASSGAATPAASAPTTSPAAAAPSPAAAPTTAAPAKSGGSKPAASAAPGGGPGLVWVNTSSKVYHCMGDRWYGKTKAGSYMSEADAKAASNRPDHGKPCS